MELKVASPCKESWDVMKGDEQVRFCERCSLNVYNLSGMTKERAEDLIRQTEGRLCVRFYQRKDGTVMSQDCPVGRHDRMMLRLTWGVAAALLFGVIVSLIGLASVTDVRMPRWMHTVMRWLQPEPRVELMGRPCPPSPPPVPPATRSNF